MVYILKTLFWFFKVRRVESIFASSFVTFDVTENWSKSNFCKIQYGEAVKGILDSS